MVYDLVVFETKEKVQAKHTKILDFLYHLYPKMMKRKSLFKHPPRKIYMQNDGTWYRLKAVLHYRTVHVVGGVGCYCVLLLLSSLCSGAEETFSTSAPL